MKVFCGGVRMNRLRTLVRRFNADQRGAEGLEILLIVAAIVLPLLGLLIYFRQEIGRWVSDMWTTIRGEADQPVPTP